MMTQIRTELYKLRTYGRFRKLLLISFAVSLVILTLILAFFREILSMSQQAMEGQVTEDNLIISLGDVLASPFFLSTSLVFMFISAVSFLYMDFANGYVKNIAGQIGSKDSYVIAKLIAVAFNNLCFFLAGSLTNLISAAVTGRFVVGDTIASGAATFLIKWLVSVALCSMLLLLAVGIKNKTVAVIVGVLFSTNVLRLIYSGVNYAISQVFKGSQFDINQYVPSSLFTDVSVEKGDLVVNAIVVSVVFIGLFLYLTCMTFKKRDIH